MKPRAMMIAAGLILCWAVTAMAATFTVNSTVDAVDSALGDGICGTAGGVCTLRAAIQEANQTADADTINLPAGTFLLTVAGAGEDLAATGDLDILRPTAIVGAGRDATIIDGLSAERVFHIVPAAPADVTFSQLTIRNGDANGGNGGGILNALGGLLTVAQVRFANDRAVSGGAISHANGALTLTDCIFQSGAVLGSGAAVSKSGTGAVNISGCQFTTFNAATGAAVFYAGPDSIGIVNSTFADCQTNSDGAAVFVSGASGLTLNNCGFQSNASAGNGGACMYSGPGDVSVTSCQFISNSSNAQGGGLNLAAATVTVSGSTFDGNLATAAGGGLAFLGAGALTITDTDFGNNSSFAGPGGGVFATIGSSVSMTNASFNQNFAQGGAGGAFLSGNGVTLTNCRFTGNRGVVGVSGGCMISGAGATSITGCSFSGNEIGNGGQGGALVNTTGGALTAVGSTFSDNRASGPGGTGGAILYASAAPGSLTNCTFSGNLAGASGGAISATAPMTLTHCTLAGNSAVNLGGAGIFANNVAVTLRNTIVANSVAGDNCQVGGTGSFSSAGGNISSDATCIPVAAAGDHLSTNPLLGSLRNNGGTVQTIELLGGSPAIDNALAAFCPGTDPRGITRPLDGNGDGTAVCDTGAFEFIDRNANAIDDTAEIANALVTDCNANGIPDNAESPDTDGDGIFDICDTCTDTDGDGFGNPGFAANTCAVDDCPSDTTKSLPGFCGCGAPETDTDADASPDCVDACPSDPAKTAAGACGCGAAETDSDGDGVANCVDNCPDVANTDQADSNGNGVGDACEPPAPRAPGCAPGTPLAVLGIVGALFCGARICRGRRIKP